jgi:signal transduction histidine kinase
MMADTTNRVKIFSIVQMKYALSYVVIIAAILGFLNNFPIIRIREMLFDSKYDSLQNEAGLIASSLSPLAILYPEAVERVIMLLYESEDKNIVIATGDGSVVYASNEMRNALRPTELSRALQGKFVFRSEYIQGELKSSAAMPIVYRNTIIGALYINQTDTEQALMIPALQSDLRLMSLAILLTAVLLAIVFSRMFTRRTLEMLSAIKAVSAGNLEYKLKVRGHDEVSELGDEFNSLTERLKRTEEVRARFVSDASHELKTPLAGIRLLTDNILQTEDADPAMVMEFVGDIGSEAERLTRITERLLALTRLDAATEAEKTVIDLAQVITEPLKMLEPLAEQHHVSVSAELMPGCLILANPDDIYQAVFNLTENAIKYNISGGTVALTLRRSVDTVTLRIEDTGVGIPKNELNNIFERFYRVDKARSRAAGGSGLGLAIVRDVAAKNNGRVVAFPRITGNSAAGSIFELTFPLCQE